MKSTNVKDAASQLISTKEHIEKLLREECNSLPEECRSDCTKQISNIIWKACLYHHGASPGRIADIQKELKSHGFNYISYLTAGNNDVRPLLNGQRRREQEMSKQSTSGQSR